jgi:hypothetical protein
MSGYKNLKRSSMEDLQKEFVPYELALRMKQLGFDEPCFSYYMNGILQPSLNVKDYSYFKEMIEINSNIKNFENVLAPLFQQSFRWFRDKYGLIGDPIPLSTSKNGPTTHYGWGICSSIDAGVDWENDDDGFKTYEEAGLACLEQLIEIVEEKQKEDGR